MVRAFWNREQPPVALLAGFPEPEEQVRPAQMLEIEEAVLSFTRAALGRAQPIFLPADRAITPLVAAIAAEFALPEQTERVEREEPLIEVAVTTARDLPLERELDRLPGVRARIFASAERGEGEFPGRQPLTDEALEQARPALAVVIGGDSRLRRDIELLDAREVPLAPVGPTLTEATAALEERDEVTRLLREVEWGARSKGSREERPEADAEAMTPYPFLMQRLLDVYGEAVERAEPRPF